MTNPSLPALAPRFESSRSDAEQKSPAFSHQNTSVGLPSGEKVSSEPETMNITQAFTQIFRKLSMCWEGMQENTGVKLLKLLQRE